MYSCCIFFFFQAEDGIRDLVRSRGLGDVYKRQVSLVHEGADGGRARLATILSTACDDFQRAIYYCLAGRGVGEMAEAMDWLLAILKARGRTAAWLSRLRVHRRDLVSPYVSEAPDGPLVSPDADFELGRSWFVDRGPGSY